MQESPTSFRDLTVAALVERLASPEPVPGGGSASAIAASLGAGLVAMVASLCEFRPKYLPYQETYRAAGTIGTELADRFLRLADEDAAAYATFAAAMKLPRETAEEQEARAAAIRAAARTAAEVPLRCVEACLELAAAAEMLAGRSNLNASSDVHVAALLADAAAHGAAANVRVNLPSVGDEAFATATESHLSALMVQISHLTTQAHAAVAAGTLREPVGAGAPGTTVA